MCGGECNQWKRASFSFHFVVYFIIILFYFVFPFSSFFFFLYYLSKACCSMPVPLFICYPPSSPSGTSATTHDHGISIGKGKTIRFSHIFFFFGLSWFSCFSCGVSRTSLFPIRLSQRTTGFSVLFDKAVGTTIKIKYNIKKYTDKSVLEHFFFFFGWIALRIARSITIYTFTFVFTDSKNSLSGLNVLFFPLFSFLLPLIKFFFSLYHWHLSFLVLCLYT